MSSNINIIIILSLYYHYIIIILSLYHYYVRLRGCEPIIMIIINVVSSLYYYHIRLCGYESVLYRLEGRGLLHVFTKVDVGVQGVMRRMPRHLHAFAVMAYIVMAYICMAYIAMAYTVRAYMAMAGWQGQP